MNKKDILFLGVGNEILMDDSIGPKILRELQNNYPIADAVYETAGLGGLELLEFIQGYKTVVFIDAIKTQDGIPGAVYYFTPADFKETHNLSNLHDVSFLMALKIGKELNMDIPENLHIIAVEIIEDKVFGEQLTEPLQKRYTGIISEVVDILKQLKVFTN